MLNQKTYKCDDCDTVITIVTQEHELHDVITCPCEKPMPAIDESIID
jgi:hypothetical protein